MSHPAPVVRSRSRRFWMMAVSAVVVVLLSALAGLSATGGFPSALLPSGPLVAGSGATVTLPLRPGDVGVAWGNLQLTNGSSDSTIVLGSVSFGSTTGELKQKVAPYVWDISGSESLDAYSLPLPSEWTRLPKHRLEGYELGPTPKEAEVVFEFDVPVRASGFSVVTVRYRIGRIQYSKSFDIAFTVCPPHDLQPCA